MFAYKQKGVSDLRENKRDRLDDTIRVYDPPYFKAACLLENNKNFGIDKDHLIQIVQ